MAIRRLCLAILLTGGMAGAVSAQSVAPPPVAERAVPGGRSGWVANDQGGCWVWAGGLGAGSSGITASWSGACPQGPAEGTGRSVVQWQVAGRQREMIYQGGLQAGKAAGAGQLDVTEVGELVSRETGDYENDWLVRGRLELPRAGLVFEGGWRLGQPHGQGELRSGGEVISGRWENGCLQYRGAWVAFTRPVEQCEGQAV